MRRDGFATPSQQELKNAVKMGARPNDSSR
jgi:hypothetical protein